MNFFLLIIFFFADSVSIQTETNLLQQGIELENKGEYQQALEVWSSALTKLETPSLAIGREYIRLVTEKNLRSHYERASSIYLWGLTAEEITPNRQALEQELAMLEPLLDRRAGREWRNLLEEEDPGLFRELRAFWQRLNPTPHTRYNERLLEHWERIAYARENFNRRNNPPYGTDDRGPAYVQYGEPDRIRTGNLNLDWGTIYSECGKFSGCSPPGMANRITTRFNNSPYYEIWVYGHQNRNIGENLIVIFGDNPSSGFSRVNIVEDLIPHRALTRTTERSLVDDPGPNFTPGMMMQLLYYQQLTYIDLYFLSRYSSLLSEWGVGDDPIAAARLGRHQGELQKHLSQAQKWQMMRHVPGEMSTYEIRFPSIPIQAWHYRLLDEQNRPVVVTILESQPLEALLKDFSFNNDILSPEEDYDPEEAFVHYELTHGLQMVGPEGEVFGIYRLPTELILDFLGDLPSSSVFTVPYTEQVQQLILYAELHNRHPDSNPLVNTPFRKDLRGFSKLESSLPEPLSTDPDILEMADIVLGYEMREYVQEGMPFPFLVANNREIPEGEELAVHLEIYNLKSGEDGFTDFTINYEVSPRRAMEWLRGRAPQDMSLALDQRTRESRFVENLEIRTRELPPGRYRLRLATIDNVSGQQMEREIEFRVVERVEP